MVGGRTTFSYELSERSTGSMPQAIYSLTSAKTKDGGEDEAVPLEPTNFGAINFQDPTFQSE